jgi:hypothetical protein
MSAEEMRVELVADTEGGDLERAEADLQYLLDELVQTDVARIKRDSGAPGPVGTRGAGGLDAGALLIALGGSGATLPVLVGLIRDWLKRRGSGVVRLRIGSDEVELTGVSSGLQQQALDEFLSRHPG